MEKTFSILYQSEKGVIHIGTGFLVYKNGLFITAGHIFRGKLEKDRSAELGKFKTLFFDKEEPLIYDILEVYFESLEVASKGTPQNKKTQKGPTYADIAIGKINISNSDYLVLDRRRPAKWTKLLIKGFMSSKLEKSFGVDFSNLKELPLITLKERNLEVSENDALITGFEELYNCSRNSVPKEHFYNNCITLQQKMHEAFGASGCPIINKKGNVIGLLIGGAAHKEEMYVLLAKYCSKSIQFKTYYLYNHYEYLL